MNIYVNAFEKVPNLNMKLPKDLIILKVTNTQI